MPTKPTPLPPVNFLRPSDLTKGDRVSYGLDHNKRALEQWLSGRATRAKERKTNE